MRDVIYRDDTIEVWDKLSKRVRTEFDQVLMTLPSVEIVQGRWIPISEGLPSDSDDVFVTVVDDHGDTPWRYTDVAWLCNGTWIANNEILFGEVIAWMPRPKPYKGDEDK